MSLILRNKFSRILILVSYNIISISKQIGDVFCQILFLDFWKVCQLLIISKVVEFIDIRGWSTTTKRIFGEKLKIYKKAKLNCFCLHSIVVPFVKCQDMLTRQKLVESQLKIGINEWKTKTLLPIDLNLRFLKFLLLIFA